MTNSIRTKRLILNLTQSDVAAHMPEGTNAMCVSYIETGKLLPTREGLNTLCALFGCLPTDLYELEDLNLLGAAVPEEPEVEVQLKTRADPANSRQHGDMVEFRTWLKPSEKDQLENAVASLGYRSMAEWFREAFRALIYRERQHRISPYPEHS